MTKIEKQAARVEAYKQLSELMLHLSELDMSCASCLKTLEKAEEQLCSCKEIEEEDQHRDGCPLSGLKTYHRVVEDLVALGETSLRFPRDALEMLDWKMRSKEKLARMKAEELQ